MSNPESIFHVFDTCEKLKPLGKITSQAVNFLKLRVNLFLDFVNVKVILGQKLLKIVIYLNSIKLFNMENKILIWTPELDLLSFVYYNI